jgi:hypothetical protein
MHRKFGNFLMGAVLKVLINNYPPPHMLLRLSRNSICGGGNFINSTFQTTTEAIVMDHRIKASDETG